MISTDGFSLAILAIPSSPPAMNRLMPSFDPHTSQYSTTSFLHGRRKFANPFDGRLAPRDARKTGGMAGMLASVLEVARERYLCLLTLLYWLCAMGEKESSLN